MKKELLHTQIQKRLKEKFDELPYMSPLTSERELCQEYQVSRPTIRKALAVMEENGQIIRIPGKGSFYIGNKIPIDYSNEKRHGFGLSQTLMSIGKVTHSHVLQQVIEVADEDVASHLQIEPGDLVFHLQRLRYVNNELYSLSNDYLPLALCPSLMEIDFSKNSLMQTLQKNQIHPRRTDNIIEFSKADSQTAAYLRLKKGAPVSVTRITIYDEKNKIIQYAISRSDAYKSRFHVISTLTE
ncbi:GntR family transcriptional regulator [Megasphaera sp.]|uniref:GntR family transcriptional regulator n=1 Tax=Megasphaera sp. TaxID=2023260 RepID=UPI0027B8E522|nr:GntR family transcriptional regulator [Megasphaera sp.]